MQLAINLSLKKLYCIKKFKDKLIFLKNNYYFNSRDLCRVQLQE
jgi:hypothetical protein